MKKYGIDLIKDFIISILLIICIVILLSIILYDDISLGKVIPETDEYFLTEEMEEEIKETNLEEKKEVVVKYYIDATDLKKYEKANEYNKGKSNPFSAYEELETGNTLSNNTSNFYEDDGTK